MIFQHLTLLLNRILLGSLEAVVFSWAETLKSIPSRKHATSDCNGTPERSELEEDKGVGAASGSTDE